MTNFLARIAARLLGGKDPGSANSGRSWELPQDPAARTEAVRWGYRLILLREPENQDVVNELATSARNAKQLRDIFIQSPEAKQQRGFPVPSVSMSGNEGAQQVQLHVSAEQQRELFTRVQSVWRALGEMRPHWSVLTGSEFLPDRINQEAIEEFYRTGEENIDMLMNTLARDGVDSSKLRTCMDFGCGLGRLSAALAPRFERVTAVDVSASHLAMAREALRERAITNVDLVQLETVEGVDRLPQADLVFSVIVLQHNPPPVMYAIFKSLIGRVAPGGVAVIQIPTWLPNAYRFAVEEYLGDGGKQMEMHAIPQADALALIRASGMELLEVIDDAWTGIGRSNTFVMRRP